MIGDTSVSDSSMNPYASPTGLPLKPTGLSGWAFAWNTLICIALTCLAWLAATGLYSQYREFVDTGDWAIGYWGLFLSRVASDLSVIAVLSAFLIGLSTAPLHSYRKLTRVITFFICVAFAFNFWRLTFTQPKVTLAVIAAFILSPMLVFGCGLLHGYASTLRWLVRRTKPAATDANRG